LPNLNFYAFNLSLEETSLPNMT